MKKVVRIFKWDLTEKELKRILLFLVKLNLLLIPLYLIILAGFQLAFLKDVTKDAVLGMLQAGGIGAYETGNFIVVPVEGGEFAGTVDWDCTGWKSMFALFALVFATDFAIRKKLLGLLFLPLVYAVNLVRIWFMFYYVHVYGTAHYSVIHATIWSWGLIAAILLFWVAWMRLVNWRL